MDETLVSDNRSFCVGDEVGSSSARSCCQPEFI